MASKNEKRAAQLGISLKEYKKTSEYKNKKSSSSSDSKKATKKIEKYHKEKEADIKKKAKIDTKSLQQDLKNILRDVGVASNRATEDYIRNIGNIAEDKDADVDDLNFYVQTQTGRTGEDLETALNKEARRFSLEGDRINQELADAGLTFSERRPEQIASESSRLATEGIQTEASRSFQDIARYEATLNRDIEQKYGRQEEEAGIEKSRTIEDILSAKSDAEQKAKRGTEDIAFGKAVDIRDISYARDTDVALTNQLFKSEQSRRSNEIDLFG